MKFRGLALAALTFTTIGASAAGVGATAHLKNFDIRVIDLDPNDGVDSFFSISTAANADASSIIYSASSFECGCGGGGGFIRGLTPFADLSGGSSFPGAGGGASIGSDGTLQGSTLSASAGAGSSGYQWAHARGFAFLPYDSGVSFTMSANTAVVVSAVATVNISLNGSKADPAGGSALAEAGMWLTDGASPQVMSSLSVLKVTKSRPHFSDAYGDYSERSLSVSFANVTSGAMEGSFRAWAKADVTMAPAVPEPETYALMLSGMAVIGLLHRRRRANRAN